MKQKRIFLKNATLITEKGDVLRHKNIFVEKGKICSVTDETGEGTQMPECDQILDCTDYYVSPGLVNLHCHCAMNIFKGIAEDVSADAWFNENIFPYESRLTADDVYVGTKLGISEMLNAGVTAFADHYFEEEAVLRAVLDMGIRADIAPTIFGTAPDFAGRLDAVSDFCERNRNRSDLVAVRLGPHAPYTCPPDTLREIVKRAEEMDLNLHMHISETREQVAASRELYGKTPFTMAYESGAFERQLLVAHGLWVEEEDMAYLTEQTWFAMCAKTYEKLAMGTGLAFRKHKELNFSFGTDGAASSNTLNICEQARHYALLGKFESWDPCTYETIEIWRAMMRGHEALSFHTGKIEPGYGADLVIWDLKKPNAWPVYHPITSILYSSEPSNVAYTMVNGVFLKEDGRLWTDERTLLDESAKVQKALLERGKGNARVFY